MSLDVTEHTFQTAVVERSATVPIVVDLWAEWCGPCKTLGPILERVVTETEGRVEMVKVDVEANPGLSQAFQVKSIPMVVAFKDGAPVDHFVGALGEHEIRTFVERLVPPQELTEVERLIADGSEDALRSAHELDPTNEDVILALARCLAEAGQTNEVIELLEKIPESEESRQIAAAARQFSVASDDYESTLEGLLPTVKDDEQARNTFVDILAVMGPDDPRTAKYRKMLTSRLF